MTRSTRLSTLRVEAEEPTASIEALHDSVLVPLGSDGSAFLDVEAGAGGGGNHMKRHAWFSTFLFAAVLSPVLLQTNTCIPIGNARLAVLELWVPDAQGESVIEGFDPDVLTYDAPLPKSEGTALLRVEAEEPTASIEALHDSVLVPLGSDGSAFLDVPMGTSELRITVSVDTGGALPYSWTYVVNVERGGEGTLSIGIDVEVGAGGGGG